MSITFKPNNPNLHPYHRPHYLSDAGRCQGLPFAPVLRCQNCGRDGLFCSNYGRPWIFWKSHSAGSDRTYSLDALPQEYPSLGTGDFRNYAVNIQNGDGSQCCNLVYISHKITSGKYALNGLPAVRASEY